MRDPITWSFPIGRIFGINVRVHVTLPFVMLGLILRATTKDGVPLLDVAAVMLLLFVSILLHEFGHCFAARSAEGDATEVLLWPLGGLAYCDLPHTPRAHLLCALGGPAANLVLCVAAGGALAFAALVPPLNPLDSPYTPHLYQWREGVTKSGALTRTARDPESAAASRTTDPRTGTPPDRPEGRASSPQLVPAPAAAAPTAALAVWQVLAAQVFWLNWFLLLLNLLPGFPLDGGRVLQAVLWSRSDYRQAMSTAAYAGFIVMLVIGVFAVMNDSVLGACLAWFIYINCKQQLIMLETGGEESPFGYDFSQGYTSLEGGQPQQAPPRRKRPNAFQRWLQNRAARKAKREMEQRGAEDRRMDDLLEKVQREGLQSLNDEERRFLTRVSARYRGGKS